MRAALTPPRLGTARSEAPTLGPVVARVARTLGAPLNAWQRLVADVSTELRPRRASRGALGWRFKARNVGALVPRQTGKSYLARARGWTQCLLPDLGVERLVGGRVGAQHVGWLCQDRASALRAWAEGVDALMDSDYRDAVRRVRLQRGDESVAFGNGSTLRVITPNRTGPRGYSLDLVLLDEALAHGVELFAALAPTQAARDNAPDSLGAQLFVLSSAGDARSTLLAALGELGRRAVLGGDAAWAWFEWSADPSADAYDAATWRATIPTLDRRGGISSAFVALQAETMDLDDFRREYLCLTTARPAQLLIDAQAWSAAPEGAPSEAITFAIDATPLGAAGALVAVGRAGGDVLAVEVVEARAGIDWLAAATVERATRWAAPVVVDIHGPVAWMAPELERAGVTVVRARSGDVLAAAAHFAAAVADGRIAHARDIRLDSAVAAARRRHSGDRWGFDRGGPVDVSALVAASLATWALAVEARVEEPQVF